MVTAGTPRLTTNLDSQDFSLTDGEMIFMVMLCSLGHADCCGLYLSIPSKPRVPIGGAFGRLLEYVTVVFIHVDWSTDEFTDGCDVGGSGHWRLHPEGCISLPFPLISPSLPPSLFLYLSLNSALEILNYELKPQTMSP